MIYKAPSLKSTVEVLHKYVDKSYKSFSDIEALKKDILIIFSADIFDRYPEDMARKFIEYRLRQPNEY